VLSRNVFLMGVVFGRAVIKKDLPSYIYIYIYISGPFLMFICNHGSQNKLVLTYGR
jgi:hypothetical protein